MFIVSDEISRLAKTGAWQVTFGVLAVVDLRQEESSLKQKINLAFA